ncbi:MAG: manganese efflux pump MntP family protein [Methanobacterium sp.]
MSPFRVSDALKFAVFFGGFQALMVILGWFGGSAMSGFVSEYASFIASGLLVFIGARIIYRNLHDSKQRKIDSLSYSVLFALAVATSIDAFVVGISFAFLKSSVLEPAIIIGLVTFFMSLCGAFLGRQMGHFFEHEAKLVGGVILIGLGISLLFLNS